MSRISCQSVHLSCFTALEKVEHLMDFAIQKAIDMGSEISAIAENRKLAEVGNIGDCCGID